MSVVDIVVGGCRGSRASMASSMRLLPLLLLMMMLLLWTQHVYASAQVYVVGLGALFGERATEQRTALEFARRRLLNNPHSGGVVKVVVIAPDTSKHPTYGGEFELRKEVCRLVSQPHDGEKGPGVAAIIASLSGRQMRLVESASTRLKVPLLVVGDDEQDSYDLARQNGDADSNVSLHLYPTAEDLRRAMIDFVKSFGWTEFAIIHESQNGWQKHRGVLNEAFSRLGDEDNEMYDVTLFDISGESYRTALSRLKYNRKQYRRFIVDIATPGVGRFLSEAKDLEMLSDNRHYMFTSLDLAALDISHYCDGGVNVTGYSIISTTSREASLMIRDWHSFHGTRGQVATPAPVLKPGQRELPRLLFETNLALVIDAAHLFSNASVAFRDARALTSAQLRCNTSDYWRLGQRFYDTMQSRIYHGLSGEIRFDQHGRRTGIRLKLVGFDTSGKLQEIGHWTAAVGLQITESAAKRTEDLRKGLGDRQLRVVVKKEEPFVMVEYNSAGEKQFRGYCIDLLKKLSLYLNFTYKIHVVRDGKTGNMDNGSWNGMVGELIRGDADLAVASLSVTAERSEVIDFTAPYMHLGISILFKKPSPVEPDMFSFLRPLHFEIWICIIGAMLAFAITMFLFARFGPYEWKNTHPCHPEVRIIENEFTLFNSFWFVIASFLQQGSEEAPKASSLRVIAGVWWFFCMIMVSSYTANLAAFLTVSRMNAPIENARDLSKQTAIKYGCPPGGATERFFQKSSIAIYQAMWNFMEANKDEVMLDTEEGVKKVLDGDYAYLMESVPLRYQLTQHCDLMEVGRELDSKFYGLGLPLGSPYTNLFSEALVNLSDAQELSMLYSKWWKVYDSPCGNDNVKPDIISQSQLGVGNFGGLYLFLSAGVALSFVVGIFEFFIANAIEARENKSPVCTVIKDDCCFAVNCCGKHKKYVANEDGEGEEADPEDGAPNNGSSGSADPATQTVSSGRKGNASNAKRHNNDRH